ncbi:hypothetical protein LSH36_93g06027, partial [Paralvinella palmiformis]
MKPFTEYTSIQIKVRRKAALAVPQYYHRPYRTQFDQLISRSATSPH